MITVAIAAEKGGVGKTTTATHLAYLAAQQGRKVLLVDMDTQGQSGGFLNVNGKNLPGMYEALAFHDEFKRGYTPMKDLVQKEVRPNLDILPTSPALGEAELIIASVPNRERILLDRLAEIKSGYDLCIMDVGPSTNLSSLLALYAADWLLIPTSPGLASRQGVEGVLSRVDVMTRRLDRAPKVAGILATMIREKEIATRELLKYQRSFPEEQRAGKVHHAAEMERELGKGQTIFELNADSIPARDYQQVFKWFCDRVALSGVAK
ncbi:ParA family protein [Deinococcus cellulosilyticus]|uniref:Sporulation initiation inhibitor Soj n=1 Tax=Deinococcus cellulosilyticus (strain DSM 18568 / NBRC 106333 / KACC 11606 / 5516J-15) TaxID=1223518 RepID=A0A511N8L2_DEIC1|nr:ParA family protein [Deinococcus cellulosilyticus]GEM48731.1 sporulation initiation inhibitor Soj [Deinococcus cellulosilyticus NBRC 106333 = KACC 11606]